MSRFANSRLPVGSPPTHEPCPGSKSSVLERIWHLVTYSTYLICLSTPVIGLLVIVLGFVLIIVSLSIVIAVLTFLFNIVLLSIGRFRAEYEYTALSSRPNTIRLLEILPGKRSDKTIFCRLAEGAWDNSTYEALSYTWACEFGRGTPATIGDHFIKLSPTLARALAFLRYEDRSRFVWIDAICINQGDDSEKSSQVQQMQNIYKNAQRVVVWLDVDSWNKLGPQHELAICFKHLELLGEASNPEAEERLWLLPGKWKETLEIILRLPWWDRIWIIQEAASNQNVSVQCRQHTVPWDSLCRVIMKSKAPEYLDIPIGLRRFVSRIRELQSSASDPVYGLLSLTHEFRHAKASENRDKLYALKGLVKTDQHSLEVTVDYKKDEFRMWKEFAKACIEKYGNLLVLATLDERDRTWWHSPLSNWVPFLWTWGEPRDPRQPLWVGGSDLHDPSGPSYSASGGSPSRCRLDLVDPDVIATQGFVYDVVEATGDTFLTSKPASNQKEVLEHWASLAATLPQEDGSALSSLFKTTVTVGRWTQPPTSASAPISTTITDPVDEVGHNDFVTIRNTVCTNRRLFTTRNKNTIGLGHADVRRGDVIAILLGSAVPFILRKSKHTGPSVYHSAMNCWFFRCPREKHIRCCTPVLYTIVGQAFVRDCMWYRGNVDIDIASGLLVVQEFLLE